MIISLGHVAVILAFFTSLFQIGFSLYGVSRNNRHMMREGCRMALTSFVCVTLGFLALLFAHITDDFSVLNVALTSHTQKPLLYKFTGVWASHEGSMMLWVLILTGFGAAMSRLQPGLPLALRVRALAVQGMTGAAFLGFILLTSNPFARLIPAPLEGNDLNPILQDPGLAFHPPFLYLGYVGFSSVFSLAAGLLLSPELDVRLIRYLRPWALTAWCSLSFGIAMGSWWSYYELGWGGYWFWDPVENAALMPWLSGTALVHSLVASARRGVLMRWTILLSILTFSLSLLGTFLVRSGILTSVHTFAVDPARGIYMLALIAVAVAAALALYAFRAPRLPESPFFAPISREGALLLNNLFLCTACATLMAGTLYPLILDALDGGVISVGPPYFNTTVVPLMLPAFVLVVIGPFLRWSESDLLPVFRRLKFAAGFSILAVVIAFYAYGARSFLGLGAIGLGVWILSGVFLDAARLRRRFMPHAARLLAHGGLALTILGIGGSVFSIQYTLLMRPGEVADVGDYRIDFKKLETVVHANYDSVRATFDIMHKGSHVMLYPEERYYTTQGMVLSHVAIATTILSDTYIALGDEQDSDGGKARTVRLNINPLVPFIWIGGAVMAAGGLAGAIRKRRAI